MKRGIISMLLIACLAAFLIPTALAAEQPTVTYDGNKISYNYTDTNQFGTAFEGMQPGEARTLEITLSNTSGETANFFMDTAVIKAFEDAVKANGAAYQVAMDVVQDGTATNIYGGTSGSTVGGNNNGLYDLNGNLNKTFLAAKIPADKTAQVRLTVALDGETNNNNYQALTGTFQFNFSVIKDDTYTPAGDTTKPSIIPGTVQTGDQVKLGLYIGILAASAVAIIVIPVVVKKRKKSGGAK
ncbi:MAG: hypothetical protein GXW99_11755 [Clostridiales bacterium]|nr:hypothetical protein [Clostridiales bacterium]